ncbi:MAG TPA: MarR family transcriptional regulator [Chloroflexota bacterium]|nr:MarR family transcriptional regulator [Chloroflexota bacterium]
MKPIQETVGFVLAQVGRLHRNRVGGELAALGLHVGQEMTLLRLWTEEGQSLSDLAECADLDLSTMSKAITRMERAGLVERRSDPEDERVWRVFLTDRGRALQEPVAQAWDEVERHAMASLTMEERILLRRLLLQVQNNLTRR